jgi:SET domain
MFCNALCFDEARDTFHPYECRASQTLGSAQFDDEGYSFAILRYLIDVKNQVKNVEHLKRFLVKCPPRKTVFDVKQKEIKDEDVLSVFNCFDASDVKLSLNHFILIKNINRALLDRDPKLKEHIPLLNQYLAKIIRTDTRYGRYYDLGRKQPMKAFLSFGSLITHSCDPNVDFFNADDKFVFIVKKPIPIGGSLHISFE